MISDSKLKKLSFLTALAGVVALYIFSQTTEPYTISIDKIMDSDIGKRVVVEGIVKNIYENSSTLFFDLYGNSHKISAVVFKNKHTVQENIVVRVTGRVSLYKGRAEIIVEKIENTD